MFKTLAIIATAVHATEAEKWGGRSHGFAYGGGHGNKGGYGGVGYDGYGSSRGLRRIGSGYGAYGARSNFGGTKGGFQGGVGYNARGGYGGLY